jgi:putative transcriptional regulator
MKRAFIQTNEFAGQMEAFKNPADLLIDIEQEVLRDLKLAASDRDIIAGAGGFTKVRVALKSEGRGKSGSTRVIYFDCPVPKRTFLVLIYSKAKVGNISDAGKNALKEMAKELKAWQPNVKK